MRPTYIVFCVSGVGLARAGQRQNLDVVLALAVASEPVSAQDAVVLCGARWAWGRVHFSPLALSTVFPWTVRAWTVSQWLPILVAERTMLAAKSSTTLSPGPPSSVS